MGPHAPLSQNPVAHSSQNDWPEAAKVPAAHPLHAVLARVGADVLGTSVDAAEVGGALTGVVMVVGAALEHTQCSPHEEHLAFALPAAMQLSQPGLQVSAAVGLLVSLG